MTPQANRAQRGLERTLDSDPQGAGGPDRRRHPRGEADPALADRLAEGAGERLRVAAERSRARGALRDRLGRRHLRRAGRRRRRLGPRRRGRRRRRRADRDRRGRPRQPRGPPPARPARRDRLLVRQPRAARAARERPRRRVGLAAWGAAPIISEGAWRSRAMWHRRAAFARSGGSLEIIGRENDRIGPFRRPIAFERRPGASTRRARSPTCARRRPGRTSCRGRRRSRFRAGCRRRGRLPPGRR